MTSSRPLVFGGNLSPVLRAVAALLVPIHLASLAPAAVLAAALGPKLPPGAPPALQEPPPEAFALQPRTAVPNPPAVPKFSSPTSDLAFSADPSDAELITARCFTDPLAPLAGKPQQGENADLARALLEFHRNPQSLSPLTTFLKAHPDSRWNAALQANLGPICFERGYWSKAREAFAQAWLLGKNATDPLLKSIIDRDLGDLATMYARLGDDKRLDALLTETAGRDVAGAGTERMTTARDSLWYMRNLVGKAFRCGPISIKRIFHATYPDREIPKAIGDLKSTVDGTDLASLQSLAQKVGLDYQAAFRAPGSSVITPAVAHWKTGHYSALIREVDGKYLAQESAFGLELQITPEVMDAEASGYFLVPAGPLPSGWRSVDTAEAKSVFGKGQVNPNATPPPPCTSVTTDPCTRCGMAGYNFEEASISLMLTDTPVGYAPPVGPAVQFTASYNHRESASMTTVSNLGNKWSFNWLSYLQSPNTTATFYGPGGGQLPFAGYNSTTGYFSAQLLNQDLLQKNSATSFTLYHKDGSQEIYNLSDGSATPRVFRTKFIDPFGNTITYAYDGGYRLRTVTDALGQTSVVNYISDTPTDAGYYRIARVTDPFGRYASFAYNASGQLTGITDVLGITSSFAYGTGDFVTSLTTPYGTTTFAGSDIVSGTTTTDRWLQATDPAGGQERIEWVNNSSAVAGTDPTATVPSSFNNSWLNYRNTFYWDKNAMAKAPGNYSQAKLIHWLHLNDTVSSTIIESTREPNENRVWRAYPGQQNGTYYVGSSNLPSRIARILDDGTEQAYRYQYNAAGNVTQFIDPLGRETDYVYGNGNNIDLTSIKQKNGTVYDILGVYTYDVHHQPLTATDASGQTTTYTYNSAGQVRTVTNAKNQTTTFWYSPTPTWTGQPALNPNAVGYLVEIDGAVTGAVTRFNYDGFGRLQAATDSEGYTVATAYDVFDRPTAITYPDTTAVQILYNRLDAEWIKDRLGRWTHQYRDVLRHLAENVDPLGRRTVYDWCTCGSLSSITDPAGNMTTWIRDTQGRVTKKLYSDGSPLIYAYEKTTSRLKSVTDALGQVTKYAYNKDNSVQGISYTDSSGNALASTPAVSYTYDPVYPRGATMADGVGSTIYAYNPLTSTPTLGATVTITPTTGAGRLYSVAGPLAGSTITYGYDELGRSLNLAINGSANLASVIYDSLGRVQTATNPLGTFGYQYVNQTGRVQQAVYPNGQVTNYGYYPNSAATPGNDDQRMQQIQNLAPGGANLSTFGYGYNAVGMIMAWSKQADAGSAQTSSFVYDGADQLTNASVTNGASTTNFSYGYDLAGNRMREQIDTSVTGSTFNNVNQLTGQSAGGPMEFTGSVNKWATITLAGKAAAVDAGGNWRGTANVATGANAIPLVATDVNGNTTTKTINITISGGASRTLTYDLDGNMVNDGAGKIYGYDAANRLQTITQGTNVTTFVYNGLGQRVQEKLNGTVIKQWVWADGAQPAEERDASNNVTNRFYAQGEQIGGRSYFFTTDHLGSIREMTDSTGAIHARYDYDPYGRITKVSGDLEADFGFTGFYRHQASGLNLTLYRAYDANLGRWPSRDPIEETGGINLYGYVGNNPVNAFDPYGLNAAAAGIILRGALVRAGVAEAVGLGPENPAADIAATGLLILGAIQAIKALTDSSKPAESQSQKKSCPANSTSSASPDPNDDKGGFEKMKKGDNTAQNKVVNQAAREAGLNKDQETILHDEDKTGMTYKQIVELAKQIKAGNIH